MLALADQKHRGHNSVTSATQASGISGIVKFLHCLRDSSYASSGRSCLPSSLQPTFSPGLQPVPVLAQFQFRGLPVPWFAAHLQSWLAAHLQSRFAAHLQSRFAAQFQSRFAAQFPVCSPVPVPVCCLQSGGSPGFIGLPGFITKTSSPD